MAAADPRPAPPLLRRAPGTKARTWAAGFVLGILLCLTPMLSQAQVTWTGGGDGTSWSDSTNWSPQTVPGSGDDVVIDAGADSTYTVEIASARTVDSLSLESNDATLAANADLTVTGGHTHVRGALTGSGTVRIEGSFRWENGTRSGTGTTVAAGGFTIPSGVTLDTRRLVLPTGATGVYDAVYNWTATNDATLEVQSGATFDIQQEGHLDVASGSASRPTLINRGTVQKTGQYPAEIAWALDNEGTVVADLPSTGSSQYLRFTGPLTDNGGTYRVPNGRLSFRPASQDVTFRPGSTIQADSSGVINFGRSTSASDTVSIRVEGTYDVKGTTTVRGGNVASVTIAAGATLQDLAGTALRVGGDRGVLTVNTTDPLEVGRLRIGFEGRLRVQSSLTVTGTYRQDPDPSSFRSDHRLTVQGPLEWEGGTMAGADTTWAEGGISLPGGFGSGSNGKHLQKRALVLPGGTTGTYSGAYLHGAESAALEVRPGATFVIQTRGGLSVASDTAARPSLRNEGLIRATNGRSDIEWDFVNNDTLDIEGPDGHLRFLGAVRSTEQVYVHVGSDAQLSYEADSSLINDGTIRLKGRLLTDSPLRNEGGTITASGSAALVQGTVHRLPNDPDTVLHNDGGKLRGDAEISGHVTNRAGTILPGGHGSAGYLDVQGTYVQGPEAVLGVDFGGSVAKSEYDLLETDRAELAGMLTLTLMDDYVPDSTDILSPVVWTDSTRTGTFDEVDGQNQSGILLAVQYEPTALQVYDGSVTTPAFAATPSYKVKSPPFKRIDREAEFSFTASVDSSVSQDVLSTVSPPPEEIPPPNNCPDTGDYDEFKCRLEQFGVTPPPPPEGESYPDLGDETLFGSESGRESDSPKPGANMAVLNGTTRAEESRERVCTEKKAEEGINADLMVGEQLMTTSRFKMCAFDLAKLALDVVPGSDCFQLAKTIGSQVGSGFVTGQFDHEAYAMAAVLDAADCASDFTPGKWVKVAQKVHSTYSAAEGVKGAVETCVPTTGSVSPSASTTNCIRATDPNDKFGPPGVRSERYTTRQDSLPYTVFFENKPDATAPAQDVVITDTLTTDRFDASTFSFGPVAFGDTTIFPPEDTLQFSTNVDLRPDRDIIVRIEGILDAPTGILRWTFTSQDPDSAGLGPTEGFLPPNDSPPEGEGSVSYFTDLEENLASGTRFGRAARIVFDDNDPIDTPVWSNVLDIAPPTSTVDSLAPTQDSVSFEVSWKGTDTESGVDNYAIYVAKNGGAFTEWVADTSATSAMYDGERGTSYSFYSVATDSVGLTEPDSAAAEASTRIASTAVPVELTKMDAALEGDGRAVALTWTTASETNNAGFEVQRRALDASAPGTRTAESEGRFRRIGFVEGAGTTSEPRSYRFTDEDLPYTADSLVYRLRQVDTDGTAHLSDPVTVARGGPEELRLRETAPNPARTRVTVRYAVPETVEQGPARLQLYDVLGREVQTVRAATEAGRHETQLSVGDLASGVYVLRLKAGSASKTRRLTVVK